MGRARRGIKRFGVRQSVLRRSMPAFAHFPLARMDGTGSCRCRCGRRCRRYSSDRDKFLCLSSPRLVDEIDYEHVALLEPLPEPIGPGRPRGRHVGRRAREPLVDKCRDLSHRTAHESKRFIGPCSSKLTTSTPRQPPAGTGGTTMIVGKTIRAGLPCHTVMWSGSVGRVGLPRSFWRTDSSMTADARRPDVAWWIRTATRACCP